MCIGEVLWAVSLCFTYVGLRITLGRGFIWLNGLLNVCGLTLYVNIDLKCFLVLVL